MYNTGVSSSYNLYLLNTIHPIFEL